MLPRTRQVSDSAVVMEIVNSALVSPCQDAVQLARDTLVGDSTAAVARGGRRGQHRARLGRDLVYR